MAEKEISSEEARRIRAKVAKQTKAKQRSKARKVATEKAKHRVYDFKGFIQNYGVVGLAVGLVLGVQVKALVDQIVASFINPILGLVLPGTDSLEKKTFVLTVAGEKAAFNYGAFLSVLVSFIAVLLIVYFGIKALRLDKLEKKS